ncbi:MAG TPA: hypothetical protein VGF14_02515 [Alphaproteobacteria bacterium]
MTPTKTVQCFETFQEAANTLAEMDNENNPQEITADNTTPVDNAIAQAFARDADGVERSEYGFDAALSEQGKINVRGLGL